MQNRFQPYAITSIPSSIYPRTGEINFVLDHQELCTHLRTAALRLNCVAILLELDEIPEGLDEALETLEAIAAEFHTDVATSK